jgi:hypothetical protein
MHSQNKSNVALTFATYHGDRLVRRDTVAHDIVKIGKDPRSHLHVEDELASRMHAVIEVGSITDITLIDLGNEPGTYVNGQRVNKCKVQPGDQLQIGSTLMVLEGADGAAVVPAANPFAGPNPFEGVTFAEAAPFAPAAAPFAATPFVAQAASASTGPGLALEPPVEPRSGGFAYSMLRAGPDVSPDEVEVPHLSAVEVMVLWDETVLHVTHLDRAKSFVVGEDASDYFIPCETLGTTRAPVVVSRGFEASLVILQGARGYVDLPSQGRISFHDLVAAGRARPSGEVSGAYEYVLPPGAKARMELANSALAFQVSAVTAGKRVPVGVAATMEPAAFLYTGMSFLLHMGLVAVFAFFMPGLKGDDSEALDRDQIIQMQKLLNAAADTEREKTDTDQVSEVQPDQKEGGSGVRAKGDEGSLGNPLTKETGHKYGVQGPKDNPDPHLARQAALSEAAQFGMIGIIASMGGGDPNAPTAPWGREDSLGTNEKSARGNMFGDTIGESNGAGGLGLSGVGEGGGGRGEGIGLGNFGNLGNGGGTGTGQGIGDGTGGIGRGVGKLTEGHKVGSPKIREVGITVGGRLPPEVIQRIVRQNFGRFRACYESGLRSNPSLQGRVGVKFVIDRTGAISLVADGGSDLPDRSVVQCVVRSFASLSFPQPEGGMVTVVYPIMFTPGS